MSNIKSRLLLAALHFRQIKRTEAEGIYRSCQSQGSDPATIENRLLGKLSQPELMARLKAIAARGYMYCPQCEVGFNPFSPQPPPSHCPQCKRALASSSSLPEMETPDQNHSERETNPSPLPPGFSQLAASPGEESTLPSEVLLHWAREGYHPQKVLGKGGFGQVYRVKDLETNRLMAMKVLRKDKIGGKNSSIIHRFRREMEVTAQLEHPGVIPLYEGGQLRSGRFFYTMKEITDKTLSRAFSPPVGAGELAPLLSILTKICETMAYAHAKGIIHRDLKPDNIGLGEYGEVYILDWGIAKVQNGEDLPEEPSPTTANPDLTQGGRVGTPGYASPEQMEGGEIDGRSDVFSSGAILYKMLTGKTPFVYRSRKDLPHLFDQPPTPPRQINRTISKDLSAMTMKALEINPNNRYQSMEDFRRDLQKFQEGYTLSARRGSWWDRLGKWSKRHKKLLLAAGAVFFLTLFTFGALLYWKSARRQRDIQNHLAQADQILEKVSFFKDLSIQNYRLQGQDYSPALAQLVKARGELEKARELAPQEKGIQRRLWKVEKAIGLLALGRKNYLLSRSCFTRGARLGGVEESRKLLEMVHQKERELMEKQKTRLREIFQNLQSGPPPSGMLDEYTTEIVGMGREKKAHLVSILLPKIKGQREWIRLLAIRSLGKLGNTSHQWKGRDVVQWLMERLKNLDLLHNRTEAREIIWALGRLRDSRAGDLVYEIRLQMGQGSAFFKETAIPMEWIPLGESKGASWREIYHQGKRKMAREKYQPAILDFTICLRKRPTFLPALNNRALCYIKLEKYSQALGDCQRSLKLKSTQPKVLHNRGLIYVRQKKYSLAREDYTRAIELEKRKKELYNYLCSRGSLGTKTGKVSLALADFKRALQIQPQGVRALNSRAKAHKKMGNFKAALRDLNLSIEKSPAPDALYDRGNTYLALYERQGKAQKDRTLLEKAVEDYQKAIKNRPQFVNAYINLGNTYGYQKKYQKALDAYREAQKINPGDPQIYKNRGRVYHLRKERKKAARQFRRYLELNSDAGHREVQWMENYIRKFGGQ